MRSLVLVAALAAATYANALGGSFHFDDAHAIEQNPSIRSLANVPRFFTDASTFSVLPQNQGYRPLLLVTYALTAAVAGVDAHAFIAVNLLVHLLCALLLYATLRELLRQLGVAANVDPIALVSALIFACHPLFSECVSYVSARSESLSSVLMMAALYAYLRARDRAGWIAAAIVAIAAALVTKPTAVVFPLILVAVEAAAAERQPLRRIAPRFLALTGVVIALALLSGRMTPPFAMRSASSFTPLEYLRSELPAIWHYVRLFFLPIGQSADPDYPAAASFVAPQVIAAAIGLSIAAAFSVWSIARRRHVGVGLAIAWFLLCLGPASSIFPLAEIVNEHRPYLAGAALCALVAAALVEGVPRAFGRSGRKVSLAAIVVVLGGWTATTVVRNRTWRNELSLWADVVQKSPTSTRAQMNYGLALMSSGQVEEAGPHLMEALRLAPAYPYAHVNLGNWLLYKGRHPEALMHLDSAIRLAPDLFWARYYRGLAAEQLGETPGTRTAFFAATTELSPSFPDGWYHLSLARHAGGDTRGALEAVRRAIVLRDGYDDRFMLAYLLLELKDTVAAEPVLDRLRAERPGDGRVQLNLAYLAKLRAGR